MADSIAGVVLAAGFGTRLLPLTRLRPKALFPVGDELLVDRAIRRFDGVTTSVAVNVHHHRDQLERHLFGQVHLSVEEAEPLGTAGALGALREWVDGRACLVANSDTWCTTSMGALLDGWDGERRRVLSSTPAPFGPRSDVAGALLPASVVAGLAAEPSGLWESVWRTADVEVVPVPDDDVCIDCGTPADYLRANLLWSGGESVIGPGAVVEGTVERCVLWPAALVRRHERLVGAIRAHERLTVVVR